MVRADVNDLVAFLDSLAKIDPVAMGNLIAARVECNDALYGHSTVQTGSNKGIRSVGMLGILNGYAGVFDDGPRKGWGAIMATIDVDGRCTAFHLTPNESE